MTYAFRGYVMAWFELFAAESRDQLKFFSHIITELVL